MAIWREFKGWMKFDNFDVPGDIESSFTVGYKLTDAVDEDWTSRLYRFKGKDPVALHGAIKLMVCIVPDLVRLLGIQPSDIAFVPALSSGESIADPNSPLSVLTSRCAEKVEGAKFICDAIEKDPYPSFHLNQKTRDEREDSLSKINIESKTINEGYILVFDDFVTTGATLSSIAGAIRLKNPKAKAHGVALGKCDRLFYAKKALGGGYA